MTSFEALDKEQKVRVSIQRDVQSVCMEACHFLGLDITKPAMELLLDVFFHKMTCYADDLERFAKHAKRTVITSEDCKLLTRRNQALTAQINSLKLPSSATKEPAKRRRTATAAAVPIPKRARPTENTVRTTENAVRTTENTVITTENIVRATEELNQSDIDSIDLTFD